MSLPKPDGFWEAAYKDLSAACQADVEGLTAERDAYRVGVNNLTAEVKELKREATWHQQTYAQEAALHLEKHDEVERLRAIVGGNVEYMRSANDRADGFSATLDLVQQTLDATRRERDQAEAEVERLKADHAAFRETAMELDRAGAKAHQERHELRGLVDDLSGRVGHDAVCAIKEHAPKPYGDCDCGLDSLIQRARAALGNAAEGA